MGAIIVILIMAALFLVLSIFLFCGRGAWLIAGYNTATKKEKEGYDEKKLCRATGMVCLVSAIMLVAMAYFGYRVETGSLAEDAMLPFGLVFICVIMTAVIIDIIYINRKCKK